MLLKKLVITGLMALGMSVPVLAMAGHDLIIRNHTECPSTTVINHGACSTILGKEVGVTKPHEDPHTVSAYLVGVACILNKHNCVAELKMTDDCFGPTVATITFDVDTGIKSITPNNNKFNYTVSGSGFDSTIEGGPASGGDLCRKNSIS